MFFKKASFNYSLLLSLLLSFSISLSNPDFAALLSFKATSDPFDSLSSWVNSSASNPCLDSWFGVTCNPVTHRVTRLVLENLNLTGPIDSLTGLTQLRLLSLENNHLFSSSSSLNLSLWPNIKHLYLSHNRFAANFPDGASTLRRLLRLDLSHNNFSGRIPLNELARLTRLLTLRLEANSFTGTLDSGDSSISSVVDFNVSGNKLSGQIPTWLSRFPRSSFTGNENLCGEPLLLSCYNRTVPSEPVRSGNHGSKGPSKAVVLIIVIIDAVAILAALAMVTWCCRYKASRAHRDVTIKPNKARKSVGARTEPGLDEGEMVAFEGCKGFSKVDDLLKASAELLGKGTVGTTYKVVMDGGGVVVVVKRVRDKLRTRNLDGWLRLIGGIRHSNIMSLRAYYHSKEELLLVSDFLPNGTLHSLLHGNRGPWRTPLDWTTRLRLASGAAEGLAFLHSYKNSKVFHGHVTSSNIIVDHQGNACVSDIGLHQLLQTPKWTNSDYKPPELTLSSNNRNYSQKSDVYSFGVVLLEILTGKRASGEGEESLVKWVQSLGREEWTWEVFDYELMRYKEVKQEMVALMEVGLLCLTSVGKDRPKMRVVHNMIEGIRTKGGVNCIVNDHSSDSSPALSEGIPHQLDNFGG